MAWSDITICKTVMMDDCHKVLTKVLRSWSIKMVPAKHESNVIYKLNSRPQLEHSKATRILSLNISARNLSSRKGRFKPEKHAHRNRKCHLRNWNKEIKAGGYLFLTTALSTASISLILILEWSKGSKILKGVSCNLRYRYYKPQLAQRSSF